MPPHALQSPFCTLGRPRRLSVLLQVQCSVRVRWLILCSLVYTFKAKTSQELRSNNAYFCLTPETQNALQPEHLFHKDLSKLIGAHVIPARSKMHHHAQHELCHEGC